jgi:hypothetical protein
MSQTLTRTAAVVFLIVCVSACGSSSSSTAPSNTTTDTFSGTVAIHGSDMHNFTVNAAGEVDVTLTAAGPPSTVVMGVGIGTPNGSSCTLLSGGTAPASAGTSPQVTGIVTPGVLCVEVYDLGNAAGPVSYTVTVKHT